MSRFLHEPLPWGIQPAKDSKTSEASAKGSMRPTASRRSSPTAWRNLRGWQCCRTLGISWNYVLIHGGWQGLHRIRSWRQGIPSGKHTKNYGTSPFFMGKSTINGPFSIAMLVITRGYLMHWPQRYVGNPGTRINPSSDPESASKEQMPTISSSKLMEAEHWVLITLGRVEQREQAPIIPDGAVERWSAGAEFGWTSQVPSHCHQMMCHEGLIFSDVSRISPNNTSS